jgi:hypothetical protein
MRTYNVRNIIESIYHLKGCVPHVELNVEVWWSVREYMEKNVKMQNITYARNVYGDDNVFWLYGVKIKRYVKPLDKAFEEMERKS